MCSASAHDSFCVVSGADSVVLPSASASQCGDYAGNASYYGEREGVSTQLGPSGSASQVGFADGDRSKPNSDRDRLGGGMGGIGSDDSSLLSGGRDSWAYSVANSSVNYGAGAVQPLGQAFSAVRAELAQGFRAVTGVGAAVAGTGVVPAVAAQPQQSQQPGAGRPGTFGSAGNVQAQVQPQGLAVAQRQKDVSQNWMQQRLGAVVEHLTADQPLLQPPVQHKDVASYHTPVREAAEGVAHEHVDGEGPADWARRLEQSISPGEEVRVCDEKDNDNDKQGGAEERASTDRPLAGIYTEARSSNSNGKSSAQVSQSLVTPQQHTHNHNLNSLCVPSHTPEPSQPMPLPISSLPMLSAGSHSSVLLGSGSAASSVHSGEGLVNARKPRVAASFGQARVASTPHPNNTASFSGFGGDFIQTGEQVQEQDQDDAVTVLELQKPSKKNKKSKSANESDTEKPATEMQASLQATPQTVPQFRVGHSDSECEGMLIPAREHQSGGARQNNVGSQAQLSVRENAVDWSDPAAVLSAMHVCKGMPRKEREYV